MQEFYDVSELVDPRPFDGNRSTYRGMPLLPISYDCDWMVSNRVLLNAACKEVFVIGCEALQEVLLRHLCRNVDVPPSFHLFEDEVVKFFRQGGCA